MSSPRRRSGRDGKMAANGDDPWVGVHMLTEFVFCPRAGLIAYEEQSDDENEVNPHVHLNFLPSLQKWHLHLMKAQLAREAGKFLIALGLLLVDSIGVLIGSGRIWWALVAGAGLFGLAALVFAWRVLRLLLRVKRAELARPREPDPSSTENQPVNWWQLQKAGYESIVYKEKLRDERWRIAGRPWRVLRKGSIRIPVFRLKRGTKKLYRQHYARMAAYCHLIEACEGAESPFGIVLYPNSYNGTSVPNSAGSRKAFHQGLLDAREVIWQSCERGLDPGRPGRTSICRGCGRGFPRVHRIGETELTTFGATVPVYCRCGPDGREYHSQCGDRFEWVPPHSRAREKGLG